MRVARTCHLLTVAARGVGTTRQLTSMHVVGTAPCQPQDGARQQINPEDRDCVFSPTRTTQIPPGLSERDHPELAIAEGAGGPGEPQVLCRAVVQRQGECMTARPCAIARVLRGMAWQAAAFTVCVRLSRLHSHTLGSLHCGYSVMEFPHTTSLSICKTCSRTVSPWDLRSPHLPLPPFHSSP